MKVGKSVRKTMEEWLAGDLDSAMLHACNAIDGTAKKLAFTGEGNRARFTRLIRENYDVFGPMGAPGINCAESKFPIQFSDSKLVLCDLADIIYRVHRCSHGHGEELPEGFELLCDAAGPPRITKMIWDVGKIKLSDRVLFGLIAVAVVCPVNANEVTDDSHYLTFAGGNPLTINRLWGRKTEFLSILASEEVPLVTMDFSNWMANQIQTT